MSTVDVSGPRRRRSPLQRARCTIASTSVRVAFAVLPIAGAAAAEFKSVGPDPVVLYDAPTMRGTRMGIAPRGMPVEVIVAQGDWVRVRDPAGSFSWVERKALVDKRAVIVTDPVPAEVRAGPDDNAPAVFRAQSGVLLDLMSPPSSGWVGVRHRDGQSGFVRVGSVWGE